MKTRIWLLSSFSLVGLLNGCGDDEAEPAPPSVVVPSEAGAPDGSSDPNPVDPHEVPDSGTAGEIMCAEMGTYCHASDTGEDNLANTCHDVGHAGDPAACAEIYDECMAFCLQDAGHNEDAGSEHPDAGALCEEIGSTCHDGSGLAQYCHEVGHAGEPNACAAVHEECMELCEADHGGDGGTHAEADSGTTDAGAQICETLGSTCHDGGGGLAQYCHEVGHDGDLAACSEIYDDCLALCHDQADSGAH
jgi:hypothetical protein